MEPKTREDKFLGNDFLMFASVEARSKEPNKDNIWGSTFSTFDGGKYFLMFASVEARSQEPKGDK